MDEELIHRGVVRVLEVILQHQIPEGHDLTRRDSEVWDSLKHIEVMFAIEEEFGVEFTESELAELDSLSKIAAALRRKQ